MYNYITHKEKEKQRHHRFHTISVYTMKSNVNKDNPKNEFFFNKEGQVRMENLHQYEKNWVDYDDIFSKIKTDFDDNYRYTMKLIQGMVGEAYKIRPFPTRIEISRVLLWVGEAYKIRPFPTTL